MDRPSAATRLLLITTAERLFAEQGINAVSLRRIGAEAGQGNDNAVRYHFGSKQGLVDAIFELRQAPIDRRRLALIEASGDAVRQGDPHAIAEAFALPLVELLADGHPSWYLRFCVQAAYTAHRDVAQLTLSDLESRPGTLGLATLRESAFRFLGRTLPKPLVAQRWWHFTGFLTHSLADLESLRPEDGGGLKELGPMELIVAGLLDSAAALLQTPKMPLYARGKVEP